MVLGDLPGVRVETKFELNEPSARQVFLAGEMTNWDAGKVAMARGADGVWRTQLSLPTGQWLYKFIVDGEWINDPRNPQFDNDGQGGRHSFVLVGDGDWIVPPTAPRGEVTTFALPSAGTKTHLYIPPGYRQGDHLPLLVLLHGSGMDADQWLKTGVVDRFMDSMIASGKIRPFIIAMPSSGGDDYTGRSEAAITEELLPMLRKEYGVSLEPRDTAIAGMSLGGSGAFYLANRHSGQFGICIPISGFYDCKYLDSLPQPVSVPFKLQFMCGSNDHLVGGNRALANILKDAGVAFDYRESAGGHDWHYWNGRLPGVLTAVSGFFGASH